ncbi:MAG: hypothetical protein IJ727_12830, partial [Treponema sp.]|nr:hypothetical protein [Treponema sp.]
MKIRILCLFFLIFSFRGFSEAAFTSDEEKAFSYLRELNFDIIRYNATSLALYPQTFSLAKFSLLASKLMLQMKDSHYLCEYYFPEKIGLIDCSFCPENLYAVSFSEKLGQDEEVIENLENADFDWLDLMLEGLKSYTGLSEEKFDLTDGSKLLELLEQGDSRGIDGLETGKIAEDNPQEFIYTKNNGDLRRFTYDGEQFTVWQEGENLFLVNFYGDKLVRKEFDSLFRLVKSETLKISGLAKNASATSSSSYEYQENSSSILRFIKENYSEKKRLENRFDASGKVIYSLESHYEEREIPSKKKKKADEKAKTENLLLNDKETSLIYDEKGRIIQEEIISWNYKKNLAGKYITEKTSQKNLYDYSSVTEQNNQPPDVSFFE